MARQANVQIQVAVSEQPVWETWVAKNDILMVVDVFSTWCGPCVVMQRTFKAISGDIPNDKTIFLTADCDKITSLSEFRGRSEPTFLFYKYGVLFKVLRGPRAAEIRRLVERYQVKKDKDEVPPALSSRTTIFSRPAYAGDKLRNNLYYVAGAADAQTIAYASGSQCFVHDMKTGERKPFAKHSDSVVSMALHPKGDIIATGQCGAKPVIWVWSAETCVELTKIADPQFTRGILALAFSSDGTKLASVTSNRQHTLCVWDWQKGKLLATESGSKERIYDIRFRPGDAAGAGKGFEEYMVTCGHKHIRFWTLSKDMNGRWTLSGRDGEFTAAGPAVNMMCLAFGDHGICYAGTITGDIYAYKDTLQIKVFTGVHKGACYSLYTPLDSKQAVSAGADGQLVVWRQETAITPRGPESKSNTPRPGSSAAINRPASAAGKDKEPAAEGEAPKWTGTYGTATLVLTQNADNVTGEWREDGARWRIIGTFEGKNTNICLATCADADGASDPLAMRLEKDGSITLNWDKDYMFPEGTEAEKLTRDEAGMSAAKSEAGIPALLFWRKEHQIDLNTHITTPEKTVHVRAAAWDERGSGNMVVGLQSGELYEINNSSRDFTLVLAPVPADQSAVKAETEAATKIQAVFRGFKARAQLTAKPEVLPDRPWEGWWDFKKLVTKQEGTTVTGTWEEDGKKFSFSGLLEEGGKRLKAVYTAPGVTPGPMHMQLEEDSNVTLNWDEEYLFPEGTDPTKLVRLPDPTEDPDDARSDAPDEPPAPPTPEPAPPPMEEEEEPEPERPRSSGRGRGPNSKASPKRGSVASPRLDLNASRGKASAKGGSTKKPAAAAAAGNGGPDSARGSSPRRGSPPRREATSPRRGASGPSEPSPRDAPATAGSRSTSASTSKRPPASSAGPSPRDAPAGAGRGSTGGSREVTPRDGPGGRGAGSREVTPREPASGSGSRGSTPRDGAGRGRGRGEAAPAAGRGRGESPRESAGGSRNNSPRDAAAARGKAAPSKPAAKSRPSSSGTGPGKAAPEATPAAAPAATPAAPAASAPAAAPGAAQ